MPSVFELEPNTEICATDSYIVSYPHLLKFFEARTSLQPADIICGAHMIYGWMPRVLSLKISERPHAIEFVASLVNRARKHNDLRNVDLEAISALVNNSTVGASKLLHFACPQHFPILDTNVHAFWSGKRRPPSWEDYREFCGHLADLQRHSEFDPFHKSIERKLGYEVSPLRSLELVMFMNAPGRRVRS